MPHQFQTIDCKKCGETYCPMCKDVCPKCGEKDIADEKTEMIKKQMKQHMHRNTKEG